MATPTFINRCVTPLFNKGVYKDGGVWVPRAVRLLAEHGSDALKPKFDKGRYAYSYNLHLRMYVRVTTYIYHMSMSNFVYLF